MDYDADDYELLMNTNLRSAFDLSREAHKLLLASEHASIVNIGSVAGLTHIKSGPAYGF